MPATIVGARSGCRPGLRAVRRAAARPDGRAARSSRARRERVALDPRRVVGIELEVDRRARRRGARRPRRRPLTRARTSGGHGGLDDGRARRRASASSSSGRGGSVCRWRSVWRTTPTWVETWKSTVPRRRRRPARSSRRRCRSRAAASESSRAGGRAEERQPRLLVAGQRRPLEPVARRAPSRRTRRRWPRRARPRSCTTRRAVAPCALDRLRVLVERRRHARLRLLAEAPAGVDALAEAGDDRLALELGHRRRRRPRRPAAASSSCRCRRPRRRSRRPGCGIGAAVERRQQVVDRHRRHLRARARPVAEPTCGTTSRFGASSSGSSAGSGSGSVTSSAAPAIAPSSSAVRSASWSTTPPRAVLIEQRGRLHPRERSSIDQVARLGGQRRVKRDEVGAASSSSSGTPDERELCTTSMPKPSARARDRLPDPAPADDPERRAGEVGAEVARAGSHVRHSPVADRGGALGTIRRASAEQQREREVGGRVGQHVGRVADRDPARGRRLDVDVVGPDRHVRDRPQLRGGVEQRRVDAVGEQREQPLGARRRARAARRATAAVSPGHSSTSCAAAQAVERLERERARDEDAGHRRAFCWHGRDPRRLLGLELRRLARARVPEGRARAALARALRDAVRHRRGQLDLLPAGQAEGRRRAGSRHAAGLRLRGQGEPVPHAHEAPDATSSQGIERFYAASSRSRDSPKLGPVLWQLPERFTRDVARLAAALDLLPRRHGTRSSSATRAGSRTTSAGAAALARRRARDRRPPAAPVAAVGVDRRTGRSCASTTARAGGAATTATPSCASSPPKVAALHRPTFRLLQQRLGGLRRQQRRRMRALLA